VDEQTTRPVTSLFLSFRRRELAKLEGKQFITDTAKMGTDIIMGLSIVLVSLLGYLIYWKYDQGMKAVRGITGPKGLPLIGNVLDLMPQEVRESK
jgi:hypothetical protein